MKERPKIGDKVKINTGSRFIESVDDYFGEVIGYTEDNKVVRVRTDDGDLRIHIDRLTSC